MPLSILKKHRHFEGETRFYEHTSPSTKTKMKFSAFLPVPPEKIENAIIWLSGLTCTDENFMTKAGAQRVLAGTRTMIVCPDTSPRGLNLPGEHDSYDFGSGAGFYVNATTEGYKDHYLMYDYIKKDLTYLLRSEFNLSKFSIMGHSMGGHGALVLGLREPTLFQSVSAFSPIVNPMAGPWGQKALRGYLGDDQAEWKKYDATELVLAGARRSDSLLIDQGLSDEFLEKELMTENFVKACKEKGQEVKVNYREGYDHSYYYISSFIEEHLRFHHRALSF